MSGNLPKPRVLVIGDAMIDIYTKGTVDRISPEAPVPVVTVDYESHRLGGAAAVAAYAKQLLPAAAVYLCAPGSGDNYGQFIRDTLNDIGVGAFCRPCLDCTTVKRRYVDHSNQHVMRADQEHDTPLEKIRAEMLSDGVMALAGEPWDIVLISDYGKGVCQPEILACLVPKLKKGGGGDTRNITRIIVDPTLGADPLKYEEPYCIVPNRREAAAILGGAIFVARSMAARNVIHQPSMAAARIRRLAGAQHCLLKLDRDGGGLSGEHGWIRFPPLAGHVADATGAGDMVLAALGAGLASGLEINQAARFAMGAAALHVEGAKQVTLAWARERVRERFTKSISVPVVGILDYAAKVAEAARNYGLRVVFTNGCFDLFHQGHLHVLQEARAQGDFLIVGINTDESVRRLKGPDRPARPLSERIAILKAVGLADVITVFDTDTPVKAIAAIKPDVLVKGADSERPLPGADELHAWGGRLHLVPVLPVRSTSDILARPA